MLLFTFCLFFPVLLSLEEAHVGRIPFFPVLSFLMCFLFRFRTFHFIWTGDVHTILDGLPVGIASSFFSPASPHTTNSYRVSVLLYMFHSPSKYLALIVSIDSAFRGESVG